MVKKMRICVIGGGAAGLSAARHLLHPPEASTSQGNDVVFEPVVYEQGDSVGGTWVYQDQVSEGAGEEVHSSMYASLRTNLPKEVMAFPDFAFPKVRHSFLHHTEVTEYLCDYAKHFGILDSIRFNTSVKSVNAIPRQENGSRALSGTVWKVEVQDLIGGEVAEETFDGVMVCNGHYSKPLVPEVPGIEQFSGDLTHSHTYRRPSDKKIVDKVVVVLGAAASGSDIGLEVATTAKKVYLSHNLPKKPTQLPSNMEQVAGIALCTGPKSFQLTDGDCLNHVDTVMFCTGYEYSFPFLDKSCKVKIEPQSVSPLYKHLINIEEPSMCFVGIPFQICPFPQFHLQSALFVNHLRGVVNLPNKEGMYASLKQEWDIHKEAGKKPRHFHKMGPLQWVYNRDIADLGQAERIPNCVENLYNDVHAERQYNLMGYKNSAFTMAPDGQHFVKLQKEQTAPQR